MLPIETKIDAGSATFAANAAAMSAAIAEIRTVADRQIALAESARERNAKRGDVMPRDRLALLLDPGTPFQELSAFAGYKLLEDVDGSTSGGGVIVGIGYVKGVRCAVCVDNFAIKGGTITESGMLKKLRFQEIVLENKLPYITLAQSGGANLRYATDTFVIGARYFANRARLSAAGIPQITVVHGAATAGGAYDPGLSDYVIMVRKKASMYLAGPPLLKAATGEIATEEELGGAEMHTEISGCAEYLAENDTDGIRIAREIMGALAPAVAVNVEHPAGYDEPLYPAEELIGVIPADPKTPYDAREVIARFVDGSRFLDFKAGYDNGTICGHAAIMGFPIGIIANNGPITARGAAKAAQFIQLCDQSGVAVLFLQNTTGFLVGKEQEQDGIIKHGSKLIQAVANCRTPRFTIMIGGSYGAGNYAMCGRGLDPRFIFAWPNSKVAVMGGAQAAMVLRIVGEARFKRQGIEMDPKSRAAVDAEAQEAERLLIENSTALYCTARVWDDGIIDPRETRTCLGELLRICREADARELRPITFGAARL